MFRKRSKKHKKQSKCHHKEVKKAKTGNGKENSSKSQCSIAATREFTAKKREIAKVLKEHSEEQKELAESAGLAFNQRENRQGQVGLAVANVLRNHEEDKKQLCEKAGVTVRTVNKYLASPDKANPVDVVKSSGRPKVYSLEADTEFIAWALDKNVPLNQKTMSGMIEKYISILRKDVLPFTQQYEVNEEGVRQHLYGIIDKMGWVMIKPVTIELKRCGIYKRLVKWFSRADVKEALSVDPYLLFNADETQINRKYAEVEKILWVYKDLKPAVPGKDRNGTHVSLFPIVSAVGEVVNPFVLLHGDPLEYADTTRKPIKCYHTANGYMDRRTFYKIMLEVFIPYVEVRRLVHGLVGKPATLVVDSHPSRLCMATCKLLIEHNINLVLFPSHTSHVVQPLDLGVNHNIKSNFIKVISRLKPVVPMDVKTRGRPPKDKKPRKELTLAEESNLLMQSLDETPEQAIARVQERAYDRYKTLESVIEALQKSLTYKKITTAWATSHLYPFRGTPHYTKEEEESLLQQITPEERSKLMSGDDVEDTNEKYYSGVLTSDEGLSWLVDFEKRPITDTGFFSSTVLNTPDGKLLLVADCVEDQELANSAEYAIVEELSETGTIIRTYSTVPTSFEEE